MCDIFKIKTGEKIAKTMTAEEAEVIVGEGQMVDELISLRDLCDYDVNVVEACNVLIALRS